MLFYNFQIGYKHENDHDVQKFGVRREERDVGMKNSQIWREAEVSWHKNAS